MSDPATLAVPLAVAISEDHLRLVVHNRTGVAGVSVADLRKAIQTALIPLTPAIEECLKNAGGAEGLITCGDSTELTVGVAPVDDVQAHVELTEIPTEQAEGRIDFYAHCGLRIVSAGQVIGQAVPYTKGRDGVSVHGRALPRNVVNPNKVSLGKNVTLGPDGKTLIAGVAGVVHVEGLRVWVEARLALDQDVDFSTGNVDFSGDVTIGRNVLDLFHVKASGSIAVLGSVEAALVEAGGDLSVHSGIAGKEKGKCLVQGNVVAKFIGNAHIEAGGSVTVKREINNARVICQQLLTVETGAIMGGQITARGGIVCETLGSPSAVRTLVEVGSDEGLRRFTQAEWPQIDADQKVIARIRVELAPLLQQAKKLNAQQKEKITEMMYEADLKEKALEQKLGFWRHRLAELAKYSEAAIVVRDRVYPGVIVHVGDLEAKIDKELIGPVKIILRRFPDGWRIIALNQLTSSVKILGAHIYADPDFEKARHHLSPPPP